jgi:hypothetical protein
MQCVLTPLLIGSSPLSGEALGYCLTLACYQPPVLPFILCAVVKVFKLLPAAAMRSELPCTLQKAASLL